MNGQNHKNFQRLAALLLALAVLAERAAGACLPVRCLVLWFLRRAEAVALAYAVETAGSPLLLAGCQRTGDTPEDALRLAGNLRALAAVFRTLAHWARLALNSSARQRGLIPAPRRLSADDPRTIAALFTRPLDTS